MTQHTCPYCGHKTEVPQLFTRARQAVFQFIWDNPGCTMKDICAALYPRVPFKYALGRLAAHCCHIRKVLGLHNEYRLRTAGFHPKSYKIVHMKSTHDSTVGIPNGTKQFDPSLS